MRGTVLLRVLMILLVPVLACGPLSSQEITPTPTKTPRLLRTVEPLTEGNTTQPVAPVSTSPIVLPTNTPLPTETPPSPATDTPVPDVPTPTETPLPPTDTPVPPPPTQPPPPPPTNTPAPPPPTQPPANQGPEVIVELPDGNTYDPGDEFTLIIIVRDPDGVGSFSWGVFTQNQTPLVGGDQECNGAFECRIQEELTAPPISGTFLTGADAVDTTGETARGVGEIYIR